MKYEKNYPHSYSVVTVAIAAGHLKAGAPARVERVAKYNRLLAIEEYLNQRGTPHTYAGTLFHESSLYRKG